MTKQFKISMPLLEKSYDRYEDGIRRFYVGGLASATNLDLEQERMAETAILAFQRSIEDGLFTSDGRWSQIPLRSGHRGEWDDILGYIVNCSVDESWNLFIEAELDPLNPNAMSLWNKMQRGDQPGRPLELGLSVGGYVVAAGTEWEDSLQTYVKVYYDVALQEVSVVGKPANPLAYVHALSKSVDWNRVKGHTVLMTEEEVMRKNKDIVAKADETLEESVVDKSNETEITEEVVDKAEEAVTEEVAKDEQVEETDAIEKATDEVEVEEVEKTADAVVESQQVEEEVAKSTDPLELLTSQVAELAKGLTTLSDIVVSLVKTEEVEEEAQAVEKSVEEEQVVETDAPLEIAEKAVDSVSTETLEKTATAIDLLVKSVEILKQRVEELENEPVDKSLAVREADTPTDPFELLKAIKAEGVNGKDYLNAAIALARQ